MSFAFGGHISREKCVKPFDSVNKPVNRDHSNESYRAVLSCGVVCYAVQGGSNF